MTSRRPNIPPAGEGRPKRRPTVSRNVVTGSGHDGTLQDDAEVAMNDMLADRRKPPTAATEYFLDFTPPDGQEQVHKLAGETSIGRHTDNVIQLLDPEVSKFHLVIRKTQTGYLLKDLGSANGTLVDGQETTTVHLVDGAAIRVGNSWLYYRVVSPAATEEIDDSRPVRSSTLTRIEVGQFDPSFESELSISEGEKTTVTFVPGVDEELDGSTSIFAVPMREDFKDAARIADDKELRRDYERLRVAFDVACAVGLQTNLQELGETILGRIRDVLFADTAVIMLRVEDGVFGPLASFADSRTDEVRIPRAIVEKVVETQEALLTHDAQADMNLRSSHTVVGQKIRSALCVPLVVQGEVFGLIHLSSSSAAGAYEQRDLELLRAIAQPAALAVANARLVKKAQEHAKTRANLSRFLSPALVDRVVKQDLSLERYGDKVLATVLFSDIRGFTEMSDGANPDAVVSMLNEYFESMVEVVFDFGGVLDKFIGDGLMAVWGTLEQSDEDAYKALLAADAMRQVLEKSLNVTRQNRGDRPLEVGFGLATGTVIAGAMGARRRQDFTVIGDTVNLSSRLCGQANPGQILVCTETAARCAASGVKLEKLDARIIKGFARPVPVYEYYRQPGNSG
jgi:adenylate cyclase